MKIYYAFQFLIPSFVVLFGGPLFASANPIRDMSITSVGTGTTVSVSTSVWTAVPGSSSLTGRQSLLISNDKANSTFMACTPSVASPSEAITVHTVYISPGATIDFQIAANLTLYCVYTGAASANIHVKEYNQ